MDKKGFGIIGTHYFSITIPKSQGDVSVVEHFESETFPGGMRTIIKRSHWEVIADRVQDNFNTRLKKRDSKLARWKQGENYIERMLGKEVMLLAWVIEGAEDHQIPSALMNWLGLAPEERWWLLTTANATRNCPGFGPNQGWRKALRIAFAENPVNIPFTLAATAGK